MNVRYFSQTACRQSRLLELLMLLGLRILRFGFRANSCAVAGLAFPKTIKQKEVYVIVRSEPNLTTFYKRGPHVEVIRWL